MPSRRTALLALALLAVAVAAAVTAATALSQGATGPTDLRVTEFDRIDAGCRDDVGRSASSTNGPNGTYSSTTFIETGARTANLSVATERTSAAGADFSVFRVNIDSHRRGPANETCEMGVQYRLAYQVTGGTDGGLLGGDSGVRILTLENGRYSGCAGDGTGRFADANCARLLEDPPERTWANATG